MSDKQKSLVDKFRGYFKEDLTDYVCVVGGANVDIIGSSLVLRKNESNVGKVSISAGGVGRNIAENLARLNVSTAFVSAVGDDHFGQIIIESLHEAGVHIEGLRRIANKQTGAYLAMLDDFREMNSAVNDMGIVEHIDRDWIGKCSDIISRARIVIADCNLKNETLDEVFNVAKGHVYVDTVSMTKAVNIIPYLKNVWALKTNVYEAEVLSGLKIDSEEMAVEALKAIMDKGVRNVVITMGEHGVLASNDGIIKSFSGKKIRAINATGAGDAFLGAWVASAFKNLSFSESIKNGMVASVKTIIAMDTVSKDLLDTNFEKWKTEVEIYEKILEN